MKGILRTLDEWHHSPDSIDVITYEEFEKIMESLGIQMFDSKGEIKSLSALTEDIFGIWDYKRPALSIELQDELLEIMDKMGKNKKIIDW